MAIDYVNALSRADKYRQLYRDGVKFEKSEAVRELAAFGLFTASELAALLGVSVGFVQNVVGEAMPESARRWKLSAIDALWHIAWNFKHTGPDQIESLVAWVVQNGTSIRAISELTGIPKNVIREAVYGHPNSLGILRAGANAESV